MARAMDSGRDWPNAMKTANDTSTPRMAERAMRLRPRTAK